MTKWCWIALLPAVVTGADVDLTRWRMQASDNHCALRQVIKGGDGRPDVHLNFTWDAEFGTEIWLTPSREVRCSSPITLRDAGSGTLLSRKACEHGAFAKGEPVDSMRKALSRGEPLLVELKRQDGRDVHYRTNVEGAGKVVADFDACIARQHQPLQAPLLVGPVWSSSVSSQGGCSMMHDVVGRPGMRGYFHSVKEGGVRYQPSVDRQQHPKGGVLRIERPGQPAWLIDTSVQESKADDRALQLLREIEGRQLPRMTFTPRGAAPVELTLPTTGLDVAPAMLLACLSKQSSPRPTVVDYSEVRLFVDAGASACELSATYQVESATVWLTLQAGENGRRLKVTKRLLASGQRIHDLGLEEFGGPRRFDGADTTLALQPEAYAALMAKVRGEGPKLLFLTTDTKGFSSRFGGRYAQAEVAMFDACVRSRYSVTAGVQTK
jgi:hypothetical protein